MPNRSIGNIQKLSEGKYLLRFSAGFDDFGKRIQVSKTVYCSSDKEAERLLMEFYTERDKCRDERVSTAPATLKQLYEEWIKNHVSKSLAIKTETFYVGLWNNHLSDKGNIKLKSIKPSIIYKILDSITKERTKNAAYKMLKSMLNKGVQWGYIDKNPCDRVETPKYMAEEKCTLTPSDIERIIAFIGKEKTKFRAIFYLSVLCGLRKQEIVALKWSDIDFANDSFRISRAATESKGKGTFTKETKTKRSNRSLYLPDMLKIELLKHKNEQDTARHRLGDKWVTADWVFTQWNGEIMSIHTPSNWWRDFVIDNKLTPITFHDLRHTAATFMIKNNVPISTVSGVLGHANVTTTLNTYTHVIEDTKKDAISVMESVFTPKNGIDIMAN